MGEARIMEIIAEHQERYGVVGLGRATREIAVAMERIEAERDDAVARAEALTQALKASARRKGHDLRHCWCEFSSDDEADYCDRMAIHGPICQSIRAALGLDDGNNPTSETPEGEL